MPPKKHSSVFTSEVEHLIIQEVRERPLLWDITIQEYRRNDLKGVHWEQIAQVLGPTFTGEMVRERFVNMRTTFMNNHRRVRESKQSGKGADDIYKPKWPLYQSLLFLQKTCKQGESSSNLESDTENSNHTESSTEAVIESISNNVYFDENAHAWMSVPPDIGGFMSLDETPISPPSGNNSELTSNSFQPISPTAPSSLPINPQTTQMSAPSPFTTVSGSSVARPLVSPLSAMSPPPRPASAPVSSEKRISEDQTLFSNRGSAKKKSSSVMESAVEALKKLSEQELPPPSQPPNRPDSHEIFTSFVAARMRQMSPEACRRCEDEIMKILMRTDW